MLVSIHSLLSPMLSFCAGLFFVLSLVLSVDARPLSPVFTDVALHQTTATSPAEDWIRPERYRAVSVDLMAFRSLTASKVNEITLPMPDGTNQRFTMIESSIMEPELQAEFPDIRTYIGQGIDDPSATLRISQSPYGFHAQVLSANGSVYIDPLYRDRSVYASYYRSDLKRSTEAFSCGVTADTIRQSPIKRSAMESLKSEISPASLTVGPTLRTYRLAVAATVEYTQFHGGTTNGAMAAIVATIARVNGVYERDLSVRMVLVANNNRLVYTSSDPYDNDDGDLLLDQNQSNVDAVIGPGNYDIGHVFSTGGGGIASLGSVCINNFKAQGVTGSDSPTGDPYDIDYVAHEIGHQFGAEHTFNSGAGSCGGNRNASTAYEPGSGSTIMAYAGICGADNIQSNSDDHFHSVSFDEIVNFITSGGGSCAVTSSTGNNPPVVDAGPSYTIPAETPFLLTATGSDPNGDTLTFAWEQRDLGPSAALGSADNGSSPLFRSLNPSTSPARSFPSLGNVVSNISSSAEVLPTTSRTMNFRVTARDNRAGGGGVSYDDTSVAVDSTKGPFVMTSLNTASTNAGIITVNWDVAGTADSPVNASFVTITLSTNGGFDYPITLNASAPNTGSALVVLPNISNDQARIKIQGAGNIFYDINNVDFSIRPAADGVPLLSIVSTELLEESCAPTNGAVDPGETVRMMFTLQNSGTVAASNVTIVLVATNGILLPDEPVFAEVIESGEQVTAEFIFTAGGVCGGIINPHLDFFEDAALLGASGTTISLGALAVSTQAHTNSENIVIRDENVADPYPSVITLQNMEGTIRKITVTLTGITHSYFADIDIMLEGPSERTAMLLSYCSDTSVSGLNITLDDAAAGFLPDSGSISSGTYKTSNYGGTFDMSPQAPASPYGASLASFAGISPNGEWKLYVQDLFQGDSGTISGGWSIQFELEGVVCCEGEPPPSVIYTASSDTGSGLISITGAGGVPYATNYLYTTADMMTPLTNWSRIGTNVSDVNGLFDFAPPFGSNAPQGYFMIQSLE